MNPKAYKLALPSVVVTPWKEVYLVRPIAEAEKERAELMAVVYLRARGVVLEGDIIRHETTVRLLAASTEIDDEEFWRALQPEDLAWLRREWDQVQLEAIPDMPKLRAAVKRLYHRDPSIKADGALAASTDHAGEFYGRPPVALTFGELAYYSAVRGVYEYYKPDSDGSRRMVSKRCLETQEE